MAYVSFSPKLIRLRRRRRHDVNSWVYVYIQYNIRSIVVTRRDGGRKGAGRTTPGLKVCPRFKNIFIADITPYNNNSNNHISIVLVHSNTRLLFGGGDLTLEANKKKTVSKTSKHIIYTIKYAYLCLIYNYTLCIAI
jgi:hypothetical protein